MSVPENMSQLEAAAKPLLRGILLRLTETFNDLTALRFTTAVYGRELKVVLTAISGRDTYELSHFSLSFLPGCREVITFHGVTVAPEWRSRGVGTGLHDLRLNIARAFGAHTVLCTVLAGNSVEKAILQKAGWRVAISVTPNIELWSREL